jgi:hypothetical protein
MKYYERTEKPKSDHFWSLSHPLQKITRMTGVLLRSEYWAIYLLGFLARQVKTSSVCSEWWEVVKIRIIGLRLRLKLRTQTQTHQNQTQTPKAKDGVMVPTSVTCAWAVRGCSALPAMGLRGYDDRSRHFPHLHVLTLATVLRGGCGSRRETSTSTAPRMAAASPKTIALDDFAKR